MAATDLYEKNSSEREMYAEAPYRIVFTFGKPQTVKTEFMNTFHAACREFKGSSTTTSPSRFGDSSKAVNRSLVDYVGRRLGYSYQDRKFLLAGYLKNVTVEFTHEQMTKRRCEATLDTDQGLGLVLAPWVRGSYVILIYQDRALPVGVVRTVYPEENMLSCAASYQSPVRGEPPKHDEYTLQELLNAIAYVPMVTGFDPYVYGYEELDRKWYVDFSG